MKLMRKAIVRELHQMEAAIKFDKSVIAYDHRGREFAVRASQSDLAFSKKEVTILCTLIAHTRGNVHQHSMTLEEQEAWLLERAQKWGHLVDKSEQLKKEAA